MIDYRAVLKDLELKKAHLECALEAIRGLIEKFPKWLNDEEGVCEVEVKPDVMAMIKDQP